MPGAKPYWGTVHHPVEDIGTGTVHARIAFHARPSELGFSRRRARATRAWRRSSAASPATTGRRMQHTKMVHVFLGANGGVVLRSRFWLGAAIRPYAPAPLAGLAARVLNRPAVRRRLLRPAVPRALARHCAEEYANLAAILPELHRRVTVPDANCPAARATPGYEAARRDCVWNGAHRRPLPRC